MATVSGPTSRVEVDDLRRALDEAGYDHGRDPYQVVVLTGPVAHCPRPTGDRTLVIGLDGLDGSAWECLAAGADDVLGWCGAATVRDVVCRLDRWRAVDAVLASPVVTASMVGGSPALRSALAEVVELAMFGSGPILLVGETGTGKELAARLAHQVASPRSEAEMVVLDCTTITPSLSGSELFGHERGAFTGADRARSGAFAAANGGTLFLDEIGELPLGLQAELLRVLQEGTYKRVGGDTWSRTSFRLVSATHRDLAADQEAGRFRSDLFHRVASGVVELPPLRERPDDLEPVFVHFLAEATGDPEPTVSAPVLALLRDREFPGNLRELRQLAFAIAARHSGAGPISPGDVPPRFRPAGTPTAGGRNRLEEGVRESVRAGLSLGDLKALVGDVAVEFALAQAGGNAAAAARALGVTDRAIQLRRKNGRAATAAPPRAPSPAREGSPRARA